MAKLHLITQVGQPYGSTRKCCERCGRAVPYITNDYSERWTTDPEEYHYDKNTCEEARRG